MLNDNQINQFEGQLKQPQIPLQSPQIQQTDKDIAATGDQLLNDQQIANFAMALAQSPHRQQPQQTIVNPNQSITAPKNTNPVPTPLSPISQGGLPAQPPSQTNPMGLIQKYFPQSEWQRAYNVMMGESGGNPGAVGDNFPINGETIPSYGLFQIRGLAGRPPSETLLNPEENVKYAAQMFNQQGWGPWTAARKLGYTK